jgi:hypothetical protein
MGVEGGTDTARNLKAWVAAQPTTFSVVTIPSIESNKSKRNSVNMPDST